ncbi:MAG: hypothetical protein HY367_02300 [Candidatus Aenigmarchaeota archaeon]|nr:hypothetical protein [Candidatus Aenigmarchaeota archaeon]
MLDWRVLAASFVALIVIVIAISGNIRIPEGLSGIIDPLNVIGRLPGGGSGGEEIAITFWPEGNHSLKSKEAVTVYSGGAVIYGFNGEITLDAPGAAELRQATVLLKEDGSPLHAAFATNTVIDGLMLGKTGLAGKISMASGNWNYTSENGSVTFSSFSGQALISPSSGIITLNGNVTGLDKK